MERVMNYSADEQLFPRNYGYSTREIIRYVELFSFLVIHGNFYLLDVNACVFIEEWMTPGVPENFFKAL